MALDLYYMAESPPCRAVMMLAKYLNIKLNYKIIDLSKGEHLTEQFAKINPHQVVPTLVDGDFVLWESRAILIYLVEKFSPDSHLYPNDVKIQAKINQWLYFDISVLYASLSAFIGPVLFENSLPNESAKQKYQKALNKLNNDLDNCKYLVSDHLTIADISLLASFTFSESIEELCGEISNYENILNWIKNLEKEIPDYNEINDKPIENVAAYIAMKRSHGQ